MKPTEMIKKLRELEAKQGEVNALFMQAGALQDEVRKERANMFAFALDMMEPLAAASEGATHGVDAEGRVYPVHPDSSVGEPLTDEQKDELFQVPADSEKVAPSYMTLVQRRQHGL